MLSSMTSNNRCYFLPVTANITHMSESYTSVPNSSLLTQGDFNLPADLLPQQIWKGQPGGLIKQANQEMCKYFGYSPKELAGTHWKELIHPEDWPKLRSFSKQTREANTLECRLRDKKGIYRWHRIQLLRQGSNGQAGQWLGINTELEKQPLETVKQALPTDDEPFQKIFEHANDGIFILDPVEDVVLAANPQACEMVGYGRKEILELPISTLHPDRMSAFHTFLQEVIDQGQGWSDSFPCHTKDDRIVPCEISAAPLRVGDKTCVIAHVRDVSDRHKANQWISGQKTILEMIAAAKPLDNVLKEMCHMIEELEPGLRACVLLLNGKREQFDRAIGPSLSDDYTEALSGVPTGPPYVGSCGKAVSKGETIMCPDLRNDDRWEDDWQELSLKHGIKACHSTPIRASDGTPVGSLMLCFSDPTKMDSQAPKVVEVGTHLAGIAIERQQAEQTLRNNEQRFRRLLEKLPAAAYTCDPNGLVTYYNERAAEVWGREPELNNPVDRFCGSFKLYLTDETPIDHKACWMALALKNKKEYHREIIIERPDGSRVNGLAHAMPFYDASGHLTGAINVVVDISEQKKAEEALKEAKEEAEKTAQLRSNLLANMSHEIRTPLTGILGLAHGLSRTVSDEQQEKVHLIKQSGKRLTDTLNSVLALAQLESGEMKMNTKLVDIVKEVEEVTDPLEPLAAEKGLFLKVIPAASKIKTCLDPALLGRILNNLVGNAIKFTRTGGVTVEIADSDDQVTIKVHDTGVGISQKFKPHLFEEFRQESTGLARSHEGIGLGLVLAKQMTQLLDGTISFESEKGKGTTFTVTFPQRQ